MILVNMAAVSEDAKYLAYGLSSSGSDWVSINVMRVEDKFLEPHTLSWVKFSSVTWTHDNKGFFYSRYPAPTQGEKLDAGTETSSNLNQELYYHFLGTEQSEDILCWKDPENPKFMFEAQVMDDGKLFSEKIPYNGKWVKKGIMCLRYIKFCVISQLYRLPTPSNTASSFSGS